MIARISVTLALLPAPALAQVAVRWTVAMDSAILVSRARAASERYRDRSEAAADGFKRVAGDAPGMGEHWVNTPRLLGRSLDPDQPTILAYTTIGGVPTLVAVAYATALGPEDRAPDFPPGAWHEHDGPIDAAAVGGNHRHHGSGGTRLAVMHVWAWIDNPDGVFAPENPRLPFLVAGLPVPEAIDPDAARSVALGFGFEAYYRSAADRALGADPAARARVDSALAEAGREVRRGAVGAADFAAVWRRLRIRLAKAAPNVDPRLLDLGFEPRPAADQSP